MNLVSFAEKNGASKIVLVQTRDHVQKDAFRKLFSVLDAERVGKKGMTDMLTQERLGEWIEKFALYEIELC